MLFLLSGSSKPGAEEVSGCVLPRLSEQLMLEELWDTLGECLTELARTPDHHAVLVLQPAVEAFFLVHAGQCSQAALYEDQVFRYWDPFTKVCKKGFRNSNSMSLC